MTDIVSAAIRSRIMAAVRQEGTGPEMAVRRYLHAAGLRYTLHDKRLPGRPDIVLPKYRTVVFVHGCFWHRHAGCRLATMPASNTESWTAKFEANVVRDQRQRETIERLGWRVETIWECETRDELMLDQLFWRIVSPAEYFTSLN